MSATLDFAVGRHVVATIDTGTFSAGTITYAGSPVAVTAKLGPSTFVLRNASTPIMPIGATRDNNVFLHTSFELELTELVLASGTAIAPLRTNIIAGAYAKIVVTVGATVATFEGLISSYSGSLEREGVSGSLTLIPIDIGTANPVFS